MLFRKSGGTRWKITSSFSVFKGFCSCQLFPINRNWSLLFHPISPLQRGNRRRKERKGEIEGCVINCIIKHSQHNLLQAEYRTVLVKFGKHFVPAHATFCYLCVRFTELFQIFIASYILRQNKHYFNLADYLEISLRTSFTRNRVH
jgi:hypothetical protein